MRSVVPVLVAASIAFSAGCGGSDNAVGEPSPGVDPNDERAVTLDCLTKKQGLPARLLGARAIQVGAPERSPRIQFYLTQGQAEAAQFEGRGEGSEQIGKALLYVNKAPDDELEKVEECLDAL
jgi:hypothetical protein